MTDLVYSDGAATVSGGSTDVVGSGTAWDIALVTGGVFSCMGYSVPIDEVVDDTHLTLSYAWPVGHSSSGAVPYAIARETSEAVRAAWINDRLAQILTQLSLAGIHPDGAGTIAERDAYSPPPAIGFLFLRVETNFDLEIYKRTGSGWDGPFSLRGIQGIGTGGLGLPTPGVAGQFPYYSAPNTISLASGVTILDLLTARGADKASAATLVLNTTTGDIVDVTGTVATTAITLADGEVRWTRAAAAWPITASANIILNNGGASYTCAAGDIILWRGYAGGVVRGVIFPVDGFGAATSALGQSLLAATTAALMQSVLGVREVLSAARTYYVRTDGNDSNTGLVNSAGGAFLTIQKAVNVVAALDMSIYQVTIQVVDGTYTAGTSFKPYVGQLAPIIQGNVATPANVIISTTGAICFNNNGAGIWTVSSMELRSTTTGIHLSAQAYGTIQYQNIRFGVCAEIQVYAFGGKCVQTGACFIVGNAQAHIAVVSGSVVMNGQTVTLSGTPAFSTAFVIAGRGGVLDAFSCTFAGTGATGPRYALFGGFMFINTTSLTYFPGNAAGNVTLGDWL